MILGIFYLSRIEERSIAKICKKLFHLESKNMETDIVIIGAGPIGIFTAFQAGMLNMKCHIIDILNQAGGQCTMLYPEKPIYDIPGYPVITAQRLIEQLVAQSSPFEPVYHFGQKIEKILHRALPKPIYGEKFLGEVQASSTEYLDVFEEHSSASTTKLQSEIEFQKRYNGESLDVITSNGTEIKCKAVIIAAGNGIFEPNRPPLDDILEYENKSVFYSVSKISHFKDKTVVIAGGGDSAVDWAIELSNVTKKIYVIHRRKEFPCAPETRNKLYLLLNSGKIEVVVPYQLDSLVGNNGQLKAVITKHITTKEEKKIPSDFLLPFFGLAMNLGPISDWDIQLEHHRIAVDPATLKTSRDRIYAIGDIATYPGKLKLILNGFAESAMACYNIYKVIYNSPVNFQYSTTKGVHGKRN